MSRSYAPLWLKVRPEPHPLGLRVEVGQAGDGCGACLDLCHVSAIHLKDGRAVIREACKGCGRCTAACPQDAIRLHLDDAAHVTDHQFALVEERTAIGAAT